MPQTDPGLDERVCRKLGWPPHDDQGGPDWPPVSTSWEWAGKALDGLPKLTPPIDWLLEFEPGPEHPYTCWLFTKLDANTGSDPVSRGDGETGPLAIARAIDAALPEPKL